MNTSTLLGRPLLLVVVLAVSSATAVPLLAASGNEDFGDPETFLGQHPSIARELYPHLLNEASDVTLFMDRNVVADLLKNYMAVQRAEDGEARAEEEHGRRKRDTTIFGDVNRQITPNGDSLGASATLEHALNDHHSASGTVGVTSNTVPGLGSLNTYTARVGHTYSPNDHTTLSLGAQRSWLPGGSTSNGVGATWQQSWDNNRHSISTNFEANRINVPEYDSFNSNRAELSYNFSPNRDTTFSLGAHRTSTPSGRDHGFGLSFIHRLGR